MLTGESNGRRCYTCKRVTVKRNSLKFFSSPTAMDDVSRFFSLITGVIQSMISPGLFFMSFL